jgi:hypothetical protein
MMTLTDTDLDSILAEATLETGGNLQTIAAQFPTAKIAPCITNTNGTLFWNPQEELYLINNHNQLNITEISKHLGRTEIAITNRCKRLQLPALSKDPQNITANRAANALGIDIHSLIKLANRGIFPKWLNNTDLNNINLKTKIIRRQTFLRWATNPLHWVYFIRSIRNPTRITDPHLHRLIQRQKLRWPDQWWSVSQVAAYHNVDHTDVNRMTRAGKINGIKHHNWWYLRSEATKPSLKFYKGYGSAPFQTSTAAADCFILIAAALGIKKATIAKLMTWTKKKVESRLTALKNQNLIPPLINKYNLHLHYDPTTGQIDGSWSDYSHRFPRLKLTDTRSNKGAASTK